MRFLGPSAHLLEALQKPGDRSSESVTALREVVFGNQEVLRQNCLPAVSQHRGFPISVLGREQVVLGRSSWVKSEASGLGMASQVAAASSASGWDGSES